jgi:hypothetical protein
MVNKDRISLFEFLLERVKETKKEHLDAEPQAFGRWFAKLYFLDPRDIFISDGSKDGKIDLFFTTNNGKSVRHHILNSKFTKEYNKIAPPAFYEEITKFWQVFENTAARTAYLARSVKPELRSRYKKLFERYDAGEAELMFVTNHRCNEAQNEQFQNIPVKIFHLDDLLQCLIDDIDGAMPRTPPIALTGIHGVISPDTADTEIATSIVFARLIDFIRYMEEDPFDLLFMRNVRVPISISKSPVNRAIQETFKKSPKEFAFSNNGITMLCEKQHYDPGPKELTLENPRVVNGSQTLHSIQNVPNPSPNARVMVRIIEIAAPQGNLIDEKILQRKGVINKIAVRSNQQNPIKKWDLVSNDDFQLELFRFFRQKGYFYERREREWEQRSRELRSVGTEWGCNIKRLTQLIASFYWTKPRLGPVVAKRVGDLFEGELYETIRQTSTELAFQNFLIDSDLWECHHDLGKDKVYIRNLKTYAYFALCALVFRSFDEVGAKWGDSAFTSTLEFQWKEWNPKYYKVWRNLTKYCIDHIVEALRKESKRYARKEGEDLTYANYFKNQRYISKMLRSPLDSKIKQCARAIINGGK